MPRRAVHVTVHLLGWLGAEEIIDGIPVPPGAGRLEPADTKFNGPPGRSLDEAFLEPLGVGRDEAWLCDLVPHTCLNDGQAKALRREVEPRCERLGLPDVSLPPVPSRFADETRRAEILDELRMSGAEVLVLLGDPPIRHFLAAYEPRWKRLSDFGTTTDRYGRPHRVRLGDVDVDVIALAHPRQVSALGTHASTWRDLHAEWRRTRVLG